MKPLKKLLALCLAALVFAACRAETANFEPILVTGVSLDKSLLVLKTTETAALTATVTPADATIRGVIWKSDNVFVATVDNGVVTPTAEGETIIRAVTIDSGLEARCSVTVETPDFPNIITDTATLQAYLSSLPAGNTAVTPYPVKLNLNLDVNNNWQRILMAITNANRFVGLDLSVCSGMSTFNPGTANTGENKIVSLVLPDTSTAIANAASYSNIVFRYFTSLKEIKGKGIITSGTNSFRALTSLQTYDFPALKTIGKEAFEDCSGLTSVTFSGRILAIDFFTFSFDGDLRDVYYGIGPIYPNSTGDPGTYVRDNGSDMTWTWRRR